MDLNRRPSGATRLLVSACLCTAVAIGGVACSGSPGLETLAPDTSSRDQWGDQDPLTTTAAPTPNDDRKELHVMSIYSDFGRTDLSRGFDFLSEIVNNDSDILVGYRLVTHGYIVDRESVGQSVKAFMDLVAEPPVKLMILGPTFSYQAEVVADAAAYFNLLEIGYATTSPILSDKSIYPMFGRTIESTVLHNPAIHQVLRFFNWTKVAKIRDSTQYVIPTSNAMQALLDKNDFTTLASTTYSSDPAAQIKQIKDSGAKIILLFAADLTKESRLYCRVYQLGLYGPRYQLLHWSGRHGLNSQLTDQEGVGEDGCTTAQLLEAVEGLMYFSPITLEPTEVKAARNIVGATGYTPIELEARYVQWLEDNNHTRDTADIFTNAMDAVWAGAMALNNSIPHLSPGKALEDFTYDDAEMAAIFFRELTKVSFQGMSGHISFDENGDRNSKVVVSQMQGGVGVPVAFYDSVKQELAWNPQTSLKFAGGYPPRDSETVLEVEVKVSYTLYVTVCVVSGVGLVYTVLAVMFNIGYRHTRLVKLSSPRINNMIAIGCALSYVSVILMGLGDVLPKSARGTWLCQIQVWTLVYGFTFAFGSMFSKTWRVHVLFTNKKLQKKIVKDMHLFAIVVGLLTVDTGVLLAWTIIDRHYITSVALTPEYDKQNEGLIMQPLVAVCTSPHMLYWTGSLYAYKGLLLIFGIFFAWETRKVRIEALNDSKMIGICVYNVMVMSVISVPLVNMLAVDQVDIAFGVTTVAILVSATTTLTLVFGQKMYLVYYHGNKVDEMTALPFAASLRDGTSIGGTSHAETRTDATLQPAGSNNLQPPQPQRSKIGPRSPTSVA